MAEGPNPAGGLRLADGLTRAYLGYGRPDRQYHFAYGPDLDPRILEELGVRPGRVTVARLPDHAVAFTGRSAAWGGGRETAVREPGASVWGAVYELRFRDALALDAFADVRLDGNGGYFHFPVEVTGLSGDTHHCLMYKRSSMGGPAAPAPELLALIVSGAEARGLPAGYVERLRRTPADLPSGAAPASPFPFTLPFPSPAAAAGLSCAACPAGADERPGRG